jgi:LAO/AO transport system kinase
VPTKQAAITEISAADAALADALVAGDRRALARAITLVESSRPDHQARAQQVLARVLPASGRSVRLGFSGAPGVGKSTFIEAFGTHVTSLGHRLAVLAIDPSSRVSGGSILGDKTRMETLSRNPAAFIRPTPSGGALGGVARRTREAMILVEAAGFDVVIVETVGVGQSETAVADMVDMFVLLLSPGGGDDLQGIKRGIMELADLLVVNKADGALEAPARLAAADHAAALHLMRPKTPVWTAEVLLASAMTGKGISDVWGAVTRYRAALDGAGLLDGRRREQARAWMWREIEDALLDRLRGDPAVAARAPALERAVAEGRITPTAAAGEVLGAFKG